MKKLENLNSEKFKVLSDKDKSLILGGTDCGATKTRQSKGTSQTTGKKFTDTEYYEYVCTYKDGKLISQKWELTNRTYNF